MARTKSKKLEPFEKILTVMVHGNPMTVQDIEQKLGQEIHMYRLSTYMWHIKKIANGVIKTIRNGRNIVSYQITNVEDVKLYMKKTGKDFKSFVPGQVTKVFRKTKNVTTTVPIKTVKPVKQISDLNSKPQKPKKVKVTKELPKTKLDTIVEDIEVTEIFDQDLDNIVSDIRDSIVD
jgi:hypothetical protein